MKSQIKTIILITLCVLSIVSTQEEKDFLKENLSTPSDFDSYTYSIQWGNTLCTSKGCIEKTKTWEKNIFNIHGLWPNGTGGQQLPDCNTGSKISFEIKDDTLQKNMNLHWPSLMGPNNGFWEHEYNKHGFCYSHKYGGAQTEFFGKAMEIYLNFEFKNIISELMQNPEEEKVEVTEDELRAVISRKYPDMIYEVDCKNKDSRSYLQELRFSFDLEIQPIYTGNQRKNCKGKIIIAKRLD